jgi:hypothetical protein
MKKTREEWSETVLIVSLWLFLCPVGLFMLVAVALGLYELWCFSAVLACFVAPAVVGFIGVLVASGMAPRPSYRPPMGCRPLGNPPPGGKR